MTELPKKITDDPYGAAILIRRLVVQQGAVYWRRYLVAFALMAVSAGATAGCGSCERLRRSRRQKRAAAARGHTRIAAVDRVPAAWQ